MRSDLNAEHTPTDLLVCAPRVLCVHQKLVCTGGAEMSQINIDCVLININNIKQTRIFMVKLLNPIL
jgi:hypothetical protein